MPVKPSDKEQEYFQQVERERIAKLREQRRHEMRESDRARRRELHHLHCAKCGDVMTVTQLEGIEIEVCPECGGIYLDAGELDKLVEAKQGLFSEALGKLRGIWK